MIAFYKMAFEKYTIFQSRSTKKEFWWFVIYNVSIIFGLNLLIMIAFLLKLSTINLILIGILFLYLLVTIIPSITLSVRRLHDTGRSGWNLIIPLLPIIGTYFIIVALLEESQPENNKWGPIPENFKVK